jgi:hypothetical protein
MNCQELDILGYVKGDLSTDDQLRTQSHVNFCSGCATEVEKTRGLLRLLQNEEWVQPSRDFTERVLTAYDAEVAPILQAARPTTIFREFLDALLGRTRSSGLSWAVSLGLHLIVFGALLLLVTTQTRSSPEDLVVVGPGTISEPASAPVVSDKRPQIPSASIGKSAPSDDLPEFVAQPRKLEENDDRPLVKKSERPALPEEEPRKIYSQWMLEQQDVMAAFGDYRKKREGREAKWDPKGEIRKAVARSHEWLKSRQSGRGHWAWKKEDDWNSDYEVGVTALVLLSYLADGHSSREGRYKEVVAGGVDFLTKMQDPSNGFIGPQRGNWLYNHMIATLALLENYLLSRDAELRMACHRAVHFIASAQNGFGFWTYRVGEPEADISVSVWAIQALRTAITAGFRDVAVVPLMRASEMLQGMLLPNDQYRYQLNLNSRFGWRGPTAMGMVAHLFSTHTPDRGRLERQASMLLEQKFLSPGEAAPDTYNLTMLYAIGTAAHLIQGSSWETYWKSVSSLLLSKQDKSGAWPKSVEAEYLAKEGGPYYVTAMSALILQTYHRHAPDR